MEDLTGKQFGAYQVVGPLGEGGMAAVYKAYQPAMDRYVALKILPRHFASAPKFVARFEREAKLLAQLQHPHILPVFDFGAADGYTYLVMPFVQGGTLTALMQGQPFPLPQIRKVISQVGDALNYAHERGLIHRDVKPSNVLLDPSGNCLLTDFGLAKIVEGSVGLTSTGVVMGTPAYMSPEQGMEKAVDGRTDIYSLGVILYEMVTGRKPYDAETPMAVILKHINDPLTPPRKLNPHIPDSVQRVVLKALAKPPGDRYQTAGDMVRALQLAIPEAVGAGERPSPVPETATQPVVSATVVGRGKTATLRRGCAWLPWVGAASLALLGIGVLGVIAIALSAIPGQLGLRGQLARPTTTQPGAVLSGNSPVPTATAPLIATTPPVTAIATAATLASSAPSDTPPPCAYGHTPADHGCSTQRHTEPRHRLGASLTGRRDGAGVRAGGRLPDGINRR